jgi:hypothetical protein
MQLVDGIYEFDSAEQLESDLLEHDEILNEYVFQKIKTTIENEDNELLLFNINQKHSSQKLSIIVERDKLIPPLKKCIEKFQELEEYEKCSESLVLIKTLEDEM